MWNVIANTRRKSRVHQVSFRRAERHVSTSHGPRGNRMQQLAALWLADCASGLMQPLTRELIFHRGYVCRVSLSPSFFLTQNCSAVYFLSAPRLLALPLLLFVLVRVIYLPSASLTVNSSHAIYHRSWKVSLFTAHSRDTGDCLRSLFRSGDRSTISLLSLSLSLSRHAAVMHRDIARCNSTKAPRILSSSTPSRREFNPSFEIFHGSFTITEFQLVSNE